MKDFKEDARKLDKAVRDLGIARDNIDKLTEELSIKHLGGKTNGTTSLLEWLKVKIADEVLYEGK